MSDYRSSAPMVFGAKAGEKITDMDWEVAVGLRCPGCYTRLDADNHCPNPHDHEPSIENGGLGSGLYAESDATGYVEDTDRGRTVCGECLEVQGFPHSHEKTAIGWFDGGSSKNPGPGAFAWAIETADRITYTGMRPLGVVTNNVAEYSGLIALLERVQELGIKKIEIRGDSQLVIEQMKGNWKVKNAELKPLYVKASELASGLAVSYVWIPREENQRCDDAVKFAIKESRNAKG